MPRDAGLETLFAVPRPLIGMVHVGALPGTPRGRASVATIVERALGDARALADAGFHGVMLENMHDRPYLRRQAGPEIVAAMTTAAAAVRAAVDLPLGIQVLAGANREALAVAHATGAAFVRAEGFVFGHIADEGIFESDAGELLRYRRAIGAEAVKIFVDVKKKHASHAVTADVDLAETARAAEFFLADGVVVTGTATGHAADPDDLAAVTAAVSLPVLIGSGIEAANLARFAGADGWIVGSSISRDGRWSEPVDATRAAALVEAWRRL